MLFLRKTTIEREREKLTNESIELKVENYYK
jgi:hypothetical protein